MAAPEPSTRSRDLDAAAQRWARVKAVFGEVADLSDADRRAELEHRCGSDAGLRGEVESLLGYDKEAAEFFHRPAATILPGVDFRELRLPVGTGSRLGDYEIAGLLGAGGMGEVYRARDLRTGEEVALKIVAAALSHPAGELRLLHEARRAAALSHPNICAIREVGQADGVPFIAMELLDGRPLSAVRRDGPLSPSTVVRYAIDVTSALEHVHAAGLVHRDLKASNVVITSDDRAIVLDFGLAKRLPGGRVDASSMEPLTASHQGPPGTLSHIAPEILRGGAADPRADIWALGVLLYQLLTGDLPFTGPTPFATTSAILGDPPKPIPGSVPLPLRLIVERCLAKDPARRYQRAGDLLNALRAVRANQTSPLIFWLILGRRRSWVRFLAAAAATCVLAGLISWRLPDRSLGAGTVAVLPLKHGGTADDEVYAAGMTEALIAQLGAATDVQVLPPASVRRIPPGRSAPQIGRELGAGAVVQGALQRDADRLSLELRIVDSASGRVRWSQSFARGPREVLVLQADAVRALAAPLKADLRPDGARRLALVPAMQPEVYEAFLKGRYEWNQRTAGSLNRAIAHFEKAVALDPAYAPAHAALADCYNQLATAMLGSGSPREYRPRAEAAAIRALQIDPNSAEAHAALGYVRHYTWQWVQAEKAFTRAIQLNPSEPLPRLWYANLLMSRGRFDEALAQAQAAREIDPFSLIVHTNLGWVHFNSRQYSAAIDVLTRAVALDGGYPQARWRLAEALSVAGRHEEALVQARETVRITNGSASSLALLAHVHARAGRTTDARRLIDEVVARSRREYVSPGMLPGVYVELGDHDQALAWMERAFDEQANAAAYFAVVPWSDPLRGDPRYRALLDRIGLEDSHAAPGPSRP